MSQWLRKSGRWSASFGVALGLVALTAARLPGQTGTLGTKSGEWPTYGGDLGHTRYSPLDQINAANFSKL